MRRRVDWHGLSLAFVQDRVSSAAVRITVAVAEHCGGTMTAVDTRQLQRLAHLSSQGLQSGLAGALRYGLIRRDRSTWPHSYALAARFLVDESIDIDAHFDLTALGRECCGETAVV